MFELLKKSKRTLRRLLLIELLVVAIYVLGNIFLSDRFPFLKHVWTLYGVLGFIVIIPAFFMTIKIRQIEKGVQKNHVTIANTLGADIAEAFSFGEIGLIGYNAKREIIWTSNLFNERGLKLLGENITQRFVTLRPFFAEENEGDAPQYITLSLNQRNYSVMHLPIMNVLVFKDISDVNSLYLLRQEEAPVVITVLMDNISDIATLSHDDDYIQIETLIRKEITDWAKDNEIFLRKIKEDVYVGVLQEKAYQKICQEQFTILNKVTAMSGKQEIPFTISLGFGRGNPNYNKLSELSAAAIDVAQSRGGNQVVVNNFGGHMEFFGGEGSESKNRRNAVRNRVLAQSFYAHLQTFKTIFIVPHETADFDAIGAALGVYALAKAAGKHAFIVSDEKQIEMKARLMLKDLFDRIEIEMSFISPSRASERVNDEVLVVAVDVNRPIITTAPKLLEKAHNVAVIDHHRRAADAIDNPLFSHVDTNASSASELVMEMISNSPIKVTLNSKVATYMLAGILLDTNGFTTRTSSATFKAAMNLKELRADSVTANNYLKDEFEEFALKTKIMSNVESPYFGIYIATAPNNQNVDKTTLAKVAQELVDVKGVKASFVIGNTTDRTTNISARSDGSINVQLIMEKMGGGGHHSSGAAQIPNSSINGVVEQLKKIIELYINEITQ